jgi:esterase/lipase
MRKIMYLHGLESSNVCDKVDFMRERAEVLAPSIDYRKSNIEEELMYMVESFQPDLIIGSSMGGFVGMLLANYYNIDCLVFNPAIHSRSIEPNLNKLVSSDINPSFTPVVVLGLEDEVIDPAKSEDMLEQVEFYCDIERVEDLGHRIPFDVFVNIYNKYVK